LGEPGKDVHFGNGRINAWRAVWAVSSASGNLRSGHARIPMLADLQTAEAAAHATETGIAVTWRLGFAKQNATIVVYRSLVPDVASAAAVAETPAIASDGAVSGTVLDADVTPGKRYYYWLILADREVETATSPMLDAVAAHTQTTGSAGLLLPLVQVAH
jgi:hypothetical protein